VISLSEVSGIPHVVPSKSDNAANRQYDGVEPLTTKATSSARSTSHSFNSLAGVLTASGSVTAVGTLRSGGNRCQLARGIGQQPTSAGALGWGVISVLPVPSGRTANQPSSSLARMSCPSGDQLGGVSEVVTRRDSLPSAAATQTSRRSPRPTQSRASARL
jgi:hypothetical protein